MENILNDKVHEVHKVHAPTNEKCYFCHSEINLVPCHGHYHCTKCGMPSFGCCEGLVEQPEGELVEE